MNWYILATDGERTCALHDQSDIDAWNTEAGPLSRYALQAGDQRLELDCLYGPVDGESIIDDINWLDMPSNRANGLPRQINDRFTGGDCEILAAALARIVPGARTYAVHEPRDDEDEPHLLVHAGVLLADGRILDIMGIYELNAWAGRWGAVAETDEWEHGCVDSDELAEMQGVDEIPENEVEEVLPLARLIATLSGLSVLPDLTVDMVHVEPKPSSEGPAAPRPA